MTYVFCYHFQQDDPLIQLEEDHKWITIFLETGNRWTFCRTHFTDRIYHYFSYFSGLAGYSGFAIVLFPDVSNLFWFSYRLCCQIADYTPAYMVTGYLRRSTLQYMYASGRNLIKNGSIWVDSDQYGIFTSRSFYIFSMVGNSGHNTNNLCGFNLFRST